MALLYHIYSWFILVVTMQFKAYQGSGDKTNQSADSTGKSRGTNNGLFHNASEILPPPLVSKQYDYLDRLI